MPLRDHFHSPVNNTHSWDEVHGGWPMEIVRELTTILPPGFRAAPQVHLGSEFDPDTVRYVIDARDPYALPDSGSAATQAALSPTLTIEAELADQDQYEVRIYDTERGRQLVAAIEIVSPANKDRPNTREVFVGKAAALLQQGVCVSLIDLVTVRQANLYAELLTFLDRSDPALAPTAPSLYAVTLRTRQQPKRRNRTLLDAWFYPMTVGQPLPTLPIWLNEELSVRLPLEPSYQETCRILGIA